MPMVSTVKNARSSPFSRARPSPRTARVLTRAAADTNEPAQQQPRHDVTRRDAMLGAATMALIAGVPVSSSDAEPAGFTTYLGLDTPPTSYGGYGGNANEAPKYAFDVPETWKEQTVNKVQKGTQGIDCILSNPRIRKEQAFVITLGRAGEDDKAFILRDPESTFAGFAGADYDLQDALASTDSVSQSKREVDGQTYFDYDIPGTEMHYLSSITTKKGKVFAMFVKTPAKSWTANESTLRYMLSSFRTLQY